MTIVLSLPSGPKGMLGAAAATEHVLAPPAGDDWVAEAVGAVDASITKLADEFRTEALYSSLLASDRRRSPVAGRHPKPNRPLRVQTS